MWILFSEKGPPTLYNIVEILVEEVMSAEWTHTIQNYSNKNTED